MQRGLGLLLTGELLTTSSALGGADGARLGGLLAQRRSARARPDRPRGVRPGAALRAARRARRRPSRPPLRDRLRPRRDRARDGRHRARHGRGRRAASGRSTRWRCSSASASPTRRRPTGRCSRRPSTTEELPRVMAMNASVWQFGDDRRARSRPACCTSLGAPAPFVVAAVAAGARRRRACSLVPASIGRAHLLRRARTRRRSPRRSRACASSCDAARCSARCRSISSPCCWAARRRCCRSSRRRCCTSARSATGCCARRPGSAP